MKSIFVIAVLALTVTASAVADPGACPSTNPRSTSARVAKVIRTAGYTKVKGSCIHIGHYTASVWRLDCTFEASLPGGRLPRLPQAVLTQGHVTKAGFYDTQDLGFGLWGVNYMAPETNGCPLPAGSPLSVWVQENYG